MQNNEFWASFKTIFHMVQMKNATGNNLTINNSKEVINSSHALDDDIVKFLKSSFEFNFIKAKSVHDVDKI